jgi:hypothetical protein
VEDEVDPTTQGLAHERLFSLREVADDFHAGRCQISTDLTLRIGDEMTDWELTINAEVAIYDNHGRPCCQIWIHRADVTLGEPQFEPDMLTGGALRDVEVITQVFGVDMDAHVWKKSSSYTRSE